MSEASYSLEFVSLQRVVAGRYSLVREIGRGGMGIVFLARDVALDRPVAIKLLPPDLARDQAFRDRFLQEARMAASLAHPHIVPIHSVEAHADMVFFVMTWVDGESLGERVRRRGPSGTSEAARIIQEVAWALSHAHAREIVHRDIKPDNILIDRESGRAMVTDFGIARTASSEPGAAPAGTPHYLSPEQARGEPGDARSDVYALGVTAWHALTGSHPFTAPSVPMLLVRQSTERAPSLAMVAPDVPARFANVIDRCLERVPSERWSSAEELAVELNAIRARSGELPGPVRAWVREILPAGNDIGMGIGGVAASLGVWSILNVLDSGTGLTGAVDNIFVAFAMTVAACLFGGLALVRLGSVAMATRDLVESGYDHDTARVALVEADTDRVSEARETPRADRRRRALAYGLTGAAKSALAIWLATFNDPSWVYLPATVLSVLLPMITIRTVLTTLHEGPGLWSRLMRGRFGTLLFTGARWFTRRRPGHAVSAGQPTIAALGLEAESLFRALPPHVQDQLHDLPAVLASLREQAERLRAADRDVAGAERLSGVVAAMEAVRLELMGMGAGVATVPDVTRNLEEARRLAERVDEALRTRAMGARLPATGHVPGMDTPR
jgi:serine/threonine-protein kinase